MVCRGQAGGQAGRRALAWHPAIAAPSVFPRKQIERGAELAAIGDCAVRQAAGDGCVFAGGRAAVSYGALAVKLNLHTEAAPSGGLKDPSPYTLLGAAVPHRAEGGRRRSGFDLAL